MANIIRIASGLTFVVLVLLILFYRHQANSAEAEFEVAKIETGELRAANSKQAETITRLTDFRAADQTTFSKLLANQRQTLQQSAATTAAIEQLKVSNENVKKYLGELVPGSLRSLLNACSADCANSNNHSKAANSANGKLRH